MKKCCVGMILFVLAACCGCDDSKSGDDFGDVCNYQLNKLFSRYSDSLRKLTNEQTTNLQNAYIGQCMAYYDKLPACGNELLSLYSCIKNMTDADSNKIREAQEECFSAYRACVAEKEEAVCDSQYNACNSKANKCYQVDKSYDDCYEKNSDLLEDYYSDFTDGDSYKKAVDLCMEYNLGYEVCDEI